MKSLFDQIQELKHIPNHRSYGFHGGGPTVKVRAEEYKRLSDLIYSLSVEAVRLDMEGADPERISAIEAELLLTERSRDKLKAEYWTERDAPKEDA